MWEGSINVRFKDDVTPVSHSPSSSSPVLPHSQLYPHDLHARHPTKWSPQVSHEQRSPAPLYSPVPTEDNPFTHDSVEPLTAPNVYSDPADEGKGPHFVNQGRQRTTSTLRTFVNLLKVYLGSGILGLPFAFKEGGVLASLVVMFVVGVIATHCMQLLVRCKHEINKRDPSMVSFSDLAYYTCGRWGAWTVDGLLVFTQFGFTCVYVVYLTQGTADLLSYVADGWYTTWQSHLIFWIPVLCVLANIQTLKSMAPIALIANFAIISGIIVIMVASCIKINDKIHGEDWDVDWWGAPDTVSVMFGMAVYAFEGIGVVLPAETAMKRPERFPFALMATMVLSTFNYIAFGLICYLGFGRGTKERVTQNLNDFADGNVAWEAASKAIAIALVIAIMATYPLQLFVVTDICEEAMFKPGRLSARFKLLKQMIFRCCLVFLAAGVAVAIPNFGLLIGLIGALGSSALQFIFPALFHLVAFKHDPWWYRSLSLFYIFFGVVGGVLGTVQTVQQIIDKYD